MDQPNDQQIQNEKNSASILESTAGSERGSSHNEAVTPKVDPKEGPNGSVEVPITKAGDGSADGEKVALSAGKASKSVRWSEQLVSESAFTPDDPNGTAYMSGSDNPYISRSQDPSPSSASLKEKMDSVRNVLGRWGKNVKEAAKKAEDLAGNTWQHLKTSPNFADAAMGRLAHSTKVIAEGGYEKIFRQTFETVPEEQLQDSYACYLSTSAGPVMGALYVSTEKLAFCSDNPLPYKNGSETDWSYYKVVIPLNQLKAVNPSSSRLNPSEKYIQIISVDNHEFWYMGFLNYESAVICLQEALQARDLQSV